MKNKIDRARYIVLLFILMVLVLCLVGCGGGEIQPNNDEILSKPNDVIGEEIVQPDNIIGENVVPPEDVVPEPNSLETLLAAAPEDTLVTICNVPEEYGLPKAEFLHNYGGESFALVSNVDDLYVYVSELFYTDEGKPYYRSADNGYLAKAGEMYYFDRPPVPGSYMYRIYICSDEYNVEYTVYYQDEAEIKDVEYITKEKFTADDEFSLREIKPVLSDNYERIKPLLGKLIEEEHYEMFENEDAATYTHEYGKIYMNNGYIHMAEIYSTDFKYPRGIKIGDSTATVLSKYPQNDGWQEKQEPFYGYYEGELNDLGDGDANIIIYGKWDPNSSGMACYIDGQIAYIEYTEEMALLRFYFENDQLTKVFYSSPAG